MTRTFGNNNNLLNQGIENIINFKKNSKILVKLFYDIGFEIRIFFHDGAGVDLKIFSGRVGGISRK